MKTNPAWQKTGSASAKRKQPLEIQIVSKADQKRFDELMGDLHYLGSAKPVGDFLRQVVGRDGEWLALLRGDEFSVVPIQCNKTAPVLIDVDR